MQPKNRGSGEPKNNEEPKIGRIEEQKFLPRGAVAEKLTFMTGVRNRRAVWVGVVLASVVSVYPVPNSRSLAALVMTNPRETADSNGMADSNGIAASDGITNSRVRISVFGLFHPRALTVEAGMPLVAKVAGRELVVEPGQRVVVSVAGEKVLMQCWETRLVGERVEFLARDGMEAEFTLAVPGKIRRMYRGRLEVGVAGFDREKTQVSRQRRAPNLGHRATVPTEELVPVVSTELETAVASVNAAESKPGAPMEALKAQAVAVRSYLVAGGPRHKLADFCDTTHCQFLKSPPGEKSAAAQATKATRGLVLAWQGKPFAAMYSASCAGRTHSLAEIGYAQRDYPYFGVECEYCRRHPERWSSTISEGDAATLVKKSEAERLMLARKLGWGAVPSNDYSLKAQGGVVDLSGVGRGHGLGLCERGGAAMARDGKNFRQILEHYYPNTTLMSIEPSGDRFLVPSVSDTPSDSSRLRMAR